MVPAWSATHSLGLLASAWVSQAAGTAWPVAGVNLPFGAAGPPRPWPCLRTVCSVLLQQVGPSIYADLLCAHFGAGSQRRLRRSRAGHSSHFRRRQRGRGGGDSSCSEDFCVRPSLRSPPRSYGGSVHPLHDGSAGRRCSVATARALRTSSPRRLLSE